MQTEVMYGGLNISRIKFSLITPKTVKSAKLFFLEIFRLCGTMINNDDEWQSGLPMKGYNNLLMTIYNHSCLKILFASTLVLYVI